MRKLAETEAALEEARAAGGSGGESDGAAAGTVGGADPAELEALKQELAETKKALKMAEREAEVLEIRLGREKKKASDRTQAEQ